jgi:hypothetical protein
MNGQASQTTPHWPQIGVGATDFYSTLTPAQQTAFNSALYAAISASACPSVDLTGITSAAGLTDAGNRGAAVDCYQTANSVGSSGPGVLDQATYTSVMGGGGSTTTPSKMKWWLIGGGVVLAGGVIWAVTRKKRR